MYIHWTTSIVGHEFMFMAMIIWTIQFNVVIMVHHCHIICLFDNITASQQINTAGSTASQKSTWQKLCPTKTFTMPSEPGSTRKTSKGCTVSYNLFLHVLIGGFHKWGIPKWMVYQGKPLKWMIWGYPHFRIWYIYIYILIIPMDPKTSEEGT